jgi:putative addiction module component (TIGR02574 family)
MMTTADLKQLSFDDKISIIEMIWDSLDPDDCEGMPLTNEQKEELDRRMDGYEHGKSKTYSWDEVKVILNIK